MNIIQLEILNLASLDREGGETINFTKGALGESTIFSIVGPTGSGKSTLLDAICLALYNRAPRYPRRKNEKSSIEIYGPEKENSDERPAPTDARNILTRGKKQGYSKLTFLANNGNIYRAEWHIAKKVKKYEKPMTCLFKLIKDGGKTVEQEVDWDELPQIIGLDYDQFLRTVLIAQGSFASFLNAKEEERYQLLEKLVGCEELYNNIAEKIKERKDAVVDAYKLIAADVAAYEKNILSDEELAALGERISQLEATAKKAKEELDKTKEALAWYDDEDKLKENIAKYENAFNAAKQQMEEMKAETDRLQLHDSTLEAVNLFREIKVCENNINTQSEALKKLEGDEATSAEAIKEEEHNLVALQESAKNAANELEKQKPHINKAREIKTQLQEIEKDAKAKTDAKDAADKALERANESVKNNAEAINKAEEALNKAVKDLESLATTIENETKQLQEKAKEARESYETESKKLEGKDIALLQEAVTSAEKKNSDLLNGIRIQTSLKDKLKGNADKEERQKQLAERNREIEKQLKAFSLEQLHDEISTLTATYTLMTCENWQLHRAQLKEGEPCPLCGSTSHPYHSEQQVQTVVDRQKSLLDKKQHDYDAKAAEQTRLLQEQSTNEGTLKSLADTLASLAKEIEGLRQEWSALHVTYPDWQEDADWRALQSENEAARETATKELTAYNALAKRVDILRKTKETAEKHLSEYTDSSRALKEKTEEEKNGLATRLAEEKAQTENLSAQRKEKENSQKDASDALASVNKERLDKQKALEAEIGNADPDTLERQLTHAKESAEATAKAKSDSILKMQGDLQGIRGKIESAKQAKQGEETLQKKKRLSLENWLTSYNNKEGNEHRLSLDDIAAFYSSTDDWEAIRSRQKDCSEAFTSAKTTLSNEKKAHEEHLPKKPEAERESLNARKEELEKLSNEELITAKAQMKNHNDAKEKMGSVFEQKKAAETLKAEWEEISNGVGNKDGNLLRKIAQCYTLRFLIEHANDEIRKFNSRYELQQVKNSLGIRVIDHDRADDVRDTTSLSGGETFIVSLGLALGLSALSSRNISFNNLFIDEGFGTLDPDTLATVIDSLAMLQSSQGKKVGVISHTDTMSERITTQIRIIKNGAGSSHVEIYP